MKRDVAYTARRFLTIIPTEKRIEEQTSMFGTIKTAQLIKYGVKEKGESRAGSCPTT